MAFNLRPIFMPSNKRNTVPADPYAPPTVPVSNDPGMTFGNLQSAPDPVHDVFMPRMQQVTSQLADAYSPRPIGTGRQILGALAGPKLGGFITGDAQKQRQIQALTGEQGSLENAINTDRSVKLADLNAQNVQSEMEDRASQAQLRNKQADLLGNPKPTVDEQVYQGYLKANNNDPVAAHQAMIADAQKAPAQSAEDKAVSDHLSAMGLADTPANRDKARLDLATRTRQPKEASENDKAISDYINSKGLPDTPANRTQARRDLKIQDRPPNQQEVTRADMAKNLNENLDQLEEILNRRGNDLFGPLKGRITGLKEFIGTNDPDIGALKATEDMMGRAQTSAHGMRNGQLVERAAQSILNSFKNGPDAVRAAIKAARSSVKTFQDDVDPNAVSADDFGDAGGRPDGSTGTLPDGTKVIARGGRVVRNINAR